MGLNYRGEQYFRFIWRDIAATWAKHPHAFKRGCGRETMMYWVRETTGRTHRKNHIRMCLEEASRRGWIRMIKEPNRCTRFTWT